jgi:hypothetical protein
MNYVSLAFKSRQESALHKSSEMPPTAVGGLLKSILPRLALHKMAREAAPEEKVRSRVQKEISELVLRRAARVELSARLFVGWT